RRRDHGSSRSSCSRQARHAIDAGDLMRVTNGQFARSTKHEFAGLKLAAGTNLTTVKFIPVLEDVRDIVLSRWEDSGTTEAAGSPSQKVARLRDLQVFLQVQIADAGEPLEFHRT